MRKKIFFILFSSLSLIAQAQDTLKVEFEKPFYKEALICDVLIHSFGEKQVLKWMKTKKGCLFAIEADTLGHVISIKEQRGQLRLSPKQLRIMKDYMKNNNVRVPFFVGEDPCSTNDVRSLRRKKMELRESVKFGQPINVYFAFNDDLVRDYEIQRKKLNGKGINLSYSYYLHYQIKRYLSSK